MLWIWCNHIETCEHVISWVCIWAKSSMINQDFNSSWKIWLFTIFRKCMHREVNLTFREKGQMLTLNHHLDNFWRPLILNALYQVSSFPVSKFWRRRYLEFFFFLPNMGMVAILVNRMEPFEQTFVSPMSGG